MSLTRPHDNLYAQGRALKERAMREQPALVLAVSEILFRHDPAGINFGDNTNEYDPEAGSIVARLHECADADDVRRVVGEEFVRWFGKGYDRGKQLAEAADEVAGRVLQRLET
jgi:hypothetical protein